MLQINFSIRAIYSLAMQRSGIPLLNGLELFNSGTDPIKDLSVEVELIPDLGEPIRVDIGTLHGGETSAPILLSEPDDEDDDHPITIERRSLAFPLSVQSVQRLVEDETVAIRCTVRQETELIHQQSHQFLLLAYNTYRFPYRDESGELVLTDPTHVDRAEVYACFVTPNHPAVAEVLKEVSITLSNAGNENALEGYQSQRLSPDPTRVIELIEALYKTLGRLKISYINPPAGVWSDGQRIRFADQVLRDGLGTCADLAPLAASCLEQMGLHPVLVLVRGHVVQGAFLSKDAFRSCDSVHLDVDRIRQLIEAKQLLLFDSSTYCASPQPPFGEAIKEAIQRLDDFYLLINIFKARLSGFTPIPIRMNVIPLQRGQAISLAETILERAAAGLGQGHVTPVVDPKLVEPVDLVVKSRFKSWKDQLLNLSLTSNPLLHLQSIDFTRTISKEFAELSAASLLVLAEQTPELQTELQEVSALVRGEADFLLAGDFNFKAQFETRTYSQGLRRLLPEPLVNPVLEIVQENSDSITEKILKRFKTVFSGRRTNALVLAVPEQLLGRLEDLMAETAEFNLVDNHGDSENAINIAAIATELSNGTCRVNPSLGFTDSLSANWYYEVGKRLAREARTAEEESGFSPLYIAFGLLQWREKSQPELSPPLLAPLVLYPVELRVNSRQQKITLVRSAGSAIGNVTLVERFRKDFDLDLDILNDLPEDEHGVDLEEVLLQVARAIEGRPGWHVIRSAVVAQFSFASFLLWRDLHDNESDLLQSEAVRQIASAGRDRLKDPVEEISNLNLDGVAAKDLPLVLPVDSTQLAAVRSAMLGRSFVLQGPPGTGKSQTITNIIAAAMAAGKTVLFVAEKKEAVDVVAKRLAATGLSPFCLDLHQSGSNSKQVVASLAEALNHKPRSVDRWDQHCRDLDHLQNQLGTIRDALHRPQKIGYSLYQMIEARLTTSDLIDLPDELDLDGLNADQLRRNLHQINELVQQRDIQGDLDSNPWHFVRIRSFTLALEESLTKLLPKSVLAINALAYQLNTLQETGLNVPEASWDLAESLATILNRRPEQRIPLVVSEPQRWIPFRQLVEQWLASEHDANQRRQALVQNWQPAFLEQDVSSYIARLEAVLHSFVLIRWFQAFLFRRRLGTVLRHRNLSLRRILDDLRSIQTLQRGANERRLSCQQLREELPDWDGGTESLQSVIQSWSAVAELAQEDERYNPLLRQLPNVAPELCAQFLQCHGKAVESLGELSRALQEIRLPLEEHRRIPLPDLSEWLQDLVANLMKLQSWASWINVESEFRASPLSPLLDWAQSADVSWDQLAETYRTGVLQHWFRRCFDAYPELTSFMSEAQERTQQRYRALDEEFQVLSQRVIQHKVSTSIPRSNLNLSGSELTVLTVEMNKQSRWLPLRKLFLQLPTLLPKLKPCILASPTSVARYLPASGPRFDLVIFDEASQLETHHAIGAMGRGKQVIVVGDDKQMPPTSFFKRATGDAPINSDGDASERLQSILSEAIAYGLPQQMLRWHYRSLHESLIEFSNLKYYRNKLYLFPSSQRASSELGLQWHPVPDGRYRAEQGSKGRVNRKEAIELTSFLVGELKKYSYHNDRHPSFGVVTFNAYQKEQIDSLTREAWLQDPELEEWFKEPGPGDPRPRHCFVKNLETVQGDERDVILFSIGFGPLENGKFENRFGKLNEDGGERRLNVAITRARRALHVFSSLDSSNINRERLGVNAEGARHLQDYLRFCKEYHQRAHRPERTNDFDGELQRQVYEVLVDAGYRVDCKVGSAGYRLDLAVVDTQDPSCYRIGIEADGSSYAAAETVRDRDRVRYEVLSSLGWKLHRVWSVAWMRDKEREKQRLLEAVRRAMEAPSVSPTPPSAPAPTLGLAQVPIPEASQVVVIGESDNNSQQPSLPLIPPPPPPPPLITPRHLGKPYQSATLQPISDDFSLYYKDQSTPLLCERLLVLLSIEAPITVADATRRVAACWGGRNLTKRAQNRLLDCVKTLQQRQQLFLDADEVLWQAEQQRIQWEGFRRPPQAGRSLDSVPPVEIRAALVTMTRSALSIDSDSLLREVCRNLTGAPNFTEQRRHRLQEQLDCLLNSGLLQIRDGRIFPTETS